MGWYHDAKQLLKPAFVRLGGGASVQRGALRLVYLSRFHKWCSEHPCPEHKAVPALYQAAADLVPADQPINYLEFGVFRGSSMRWWLQHQSHPNSLFAGFDTFTGLPEDWLPDKPKGTFSTEGIAPDVGDTRCQFVKGLFQDTLVPFTAHVDWSRPTVIHLDADLFSSTLFVLLTVMPRLKPGDMLIFDEFHDYLDEFRAFESLCSAWPFRYEVVGQHGGYARVVVRLT